MGTVKSSFFMGIMGTVKSSLFKVLVPPSFDYRKKAETNYLQSYLKAWFPLDRNGIVKSCDSSFLKLIVKRSIKTENKNLSEIASDL